ncbi:MAG TPA: flagellar basal body P-ring formation chaperone FlgA [Microvirga sp.]|jgi:flagella basal body P-ring formation protein FlgA|nr:flagellar basal body P-ring formation chaperone FlgA [Microvirga sp.]
MTIHLHAHAPRRKAHLVSPSMVLRAALTVAAFTMAIVPVLAANLRGDVTATADILTAGDLIEGLQGSAASHPLFRAPAPGETGTIQVRRIVDAAAALGIKGVDTAGRAQISVSRAARRVGQAEIEAALKGQLEAQHGVDARALSIVFEGAPALVVQPDVKAPVTVEEVVYDRRSRRVSALVSISPTPGERRASARVNGSLVELVQVAVVNRAFVRGETVQASDINLERRAREAVPQDAEGEEAVLPGRIARRALSAGAVIRTSDLAKPELVARGDLVTVVYEIPGLVLTLRGRAEQAGAQGDVITVTNPQSKRTLQGQVVAAGRVQVSAPVPGPVASARP